LRWARTIRVCQPVPYFFSILSNPTLWPLAWAVCAPTPLTLSILGAAVITRGVVVIDLERRLTNASPPLNRFWLAPLKDLLQLGLWLGAFLGNQVEWRGTRMRLKRDGTITLIS
jgi:ceramide glucosyltransferase